jgi:hypothetical protein
MTLMVEQAKGMGEYIFGAIFLYTNKALLGGRGAGGVDIL